MPELVLVGCEVVDQGGQCRGSGVRPGDDEDVRLCEEPFLGLRVRLVSQQPGEEVLAGEGVLSCDASADEVAGVFEEEVKFLLDAVR